MKLLPLTLILFYSLNTYAFSHPLLALSEGASTYVDSESSLYVFGGEVTPTQNCQHTPHRVGTDRFIKIDFAKSTKDILKEGPHPSPRTRATLVSDTDNKRLILFGGRSRKKKSGKYQLHNDLWIYDIEEDTWGRITPKGQEPAPRRDIPKSCGF